MRDMEEKKEILEQVQRLAAAFSSVTSIPVQIIQMQEEQPVFCCRFCRLLAEVSNLSCGCADTLQQYGKTAQNLGGSHIFFCPTGVIGLVSPVLYRGEQIAVAAAGPFRLNGFHMSSANDLIKRFAFTACEAEETERQQRILTCLSAAQISRAALLLQAAMKHSGAAALPYEYMNQTENELLAAIRTGKNQEVNMIVKNGIAQLFPLYAKHEASLRNHCLQFSFMLCRILSDCVPENVRAQYAMDALLRQLCGCYDRASLRFCMRRIRKLFSECFAQKMSKPLSDAVRDTVTYIHENYMTRITLVSAAEHVFLSPAHLSRKFKAETGKRFHQYINEVRIEKAKQRLRSSNAALTDIAQSSGFESYAYFSGVFRQVEGITPSEYRRAGNQI